MFYPFIRTYICRAKCLMLLVTSDTEQTERVIERDKEKATEREKERYIHKQTVRICWKKWDT